MEMPHQNSRAPRTKRWRDVRAKAVKEGRLDERAVAAHKRRLLAATHHHALTERRQAAGLTQGDLAERIRIPETDITHIEQGQLDELRVATLRAYVRELGGDLELAAQFGDERLNLT